MITCSKYIYFKSLELGCFLVAAIGLLIALTSLNANIFDKPKTSSGTSDSPLVSISECFAKGAVANQVQVTESAIIHDLRRVSGLPSAYLGSSYSSVNQNVDVCSLKLV